MKKLFSLLLTLCLAMTLLAVVPVAAAPGEVLVGTPNVDGVLDDIYKQSLTVVYDGDPAKNEAAGDWWDASGTFYALYDNKYVYVCAVIKDDDVVSAADAYVLRDSNPYMNDVVEFRFDFGNNPDEAYDESDTFFKVGVDAYGKRKYTYFSPVVDINTCVHATKVTSDGYVIELAVPHSTNEYNQLLTSGKLGITYWLFDLHADAEGIVKPIYEIDYVHYAIQAEGKANTECSYYELSTKKVTGGATPTPDVTLAPETTAAPETTVAPETTEAPVDDTTAAPEDTTAADVEVDDTTAAEEDTTAAEGEETTAAEEDTTEAEVADTTAAEEADDTTVAEDEKDTTAADVEEDTTAADADEDKGGFPVGIIIAIVAAVVVIAGIAVALAKKKK